MKIYVTEDEISNQLNIVELEDITIIGEYISIEDDNYMLIGTAIIDGEMYDDFQVEFTPITMTNTDSFTSIMDTEWDYYNYLF